jgi:hypothetical protein
MKGIALLFVAVSLAFTTGCMSTHVVKNKARPHAEYGAEVEGQPGYYALLPLTIPADLATYPVQIIFFSGGSVSHGGRLTIDGWPIPLP